MVLIGDTTNQDFLKCNMSRPASPPSPCCFSLSSVGSASVSVPVSCFFSLPLSMCACVFSVCPQTC